MLNQKSYSVFTALTVCFFFSNLPVYLFEMEIWPYTPLDFIILTGLMALSLFVAKQSVYRDDKVESFTTNPIVYWLFLYLLIICIWFIPSSQTEGVIKLFRRQLLSIIFLSLILFILSGSSSLQQLTRRILFICIVIAVFNNIFEFLNPFSFVPLHYEFANPGRSAGLYINANQAGAAIVLGAIFSIGIVPNRYKSGFILMCTVGIAMTFSRSSIISWLIVCLVFTRQNLLTVKNLMFSLSLLIVITVISHAGILNFIEGQRDINVSNILNRVEWFMDPVGVKDFSAVERRQVSKLAWEMFLDSPILGNGIGSTITWGERVSTHNMYLYFAADYGLLGLFILPLLGVAITWKAQGEAKQIAIPFLAFTFFFSLFSHNVLNEYYFLISFALMAAMSYQSRLNGDIHE